MTRTLVIYCRNVPQRESHVGYTVSNKIGKAVVRNRIRRRFREIVRLNEPRLKEHVEMVIVARTRAASADYAQLEKDFLKACGELELLKGEENG